MESTLHLDQVVESQLLSLDDGDMYASAWADAVAAGKAWGGRGRGGRGLARRTYQPKTIVVENVSLLYTSDASLSQKQLLEGATLKLLPGRVYALVGRNGCGKSTLLRRIHAGKIPGFPTHISTMYVPQEVLPDPHKTALDIILSFHDTFFQTSSAATRELIEKMEADLELLDAQDSEDMEKICNQISDLEQELDGGHDIQAIRSQAEEALKFFGLDESVWDIPSEQLSGGLRKKISLASSLFCQQDLLLLDEPTNYVDISGLIQLRRLLEASKERSATVLMVSHDVDLINDVATDVIHFHDQTLTYYPGNYRDFVGYRSQRTMHMLRQNAALEKKRDHMLQTIEHLKKQPISKRGGAKKKGKQIESRKKKLEKQGLEKDEHGHRWTAQTAGTGIREGSINSVGASDRSKLSHQQLLRALETDTLPVPDKAVQFVFRNTLSTWGEPLIMAMDVGFGYDIASAQSSIEESMTQPVLEKKDGFLFDCVDICIEEGTANCILAPNGSGKTTLLRLLAKLEEPVEGRVYHAQNANVAYFDQHVVDNLIESSFAQGRATTPLSLLAQRYPNKTEQDLRGELSSFGLDPLQATTNVRFMSGGERSRLCLASLMLSDPDVLLMDEPTSHLDVESVEALAYGLKQWNGTVVMVSHDTNLIRMLEGRCYVIMEQEGKIRTIPDGIDFYLRSLALQ
jgi:ATPase subunit of ABC transporter with duplicated ATPase domains